MRTFKIYIVLGKAKEKAKSIACLSNLRQLGLVMGSYTADFDGYLPPYKQGTDKVRWTGTLLAHSNLHGKLLWCESLINPVYRDIYTNIFTPNYIKTRSGATGLKYPAYTMPRTFGLASGSDIIAVPKVERIKSQSSTVLLLDGVGLAPVAADGGYYRGYYYGREAFVTSGSWAIADNRHAGAVNCLFIDGHAKGITTPCSLPNSAYSSTMNPYLFEPFAAVQNQYFWNCNK